ncbi:hypothetical protein ACLOJK_027919 [Asimina triloba]
MPEIVSRVRRTPLLMASLGLPSTVHLPRLTVLGWQLWASPTSALAHFNCHHRLSPLPAADSSLIVITSAPQLGFVFGLNLVPNPHASAGPHLALSSAAPARMKGGNGLGDFSNFSLGTSR